MFPFVKKVWEKEKKLNEWNFHYMLTLLFAFPDALELEKLLWKIEITNKTRIIPLIHSAQIYF